MPFARGVRFWKQRSLGTHLSGRPRFAGGSFSVSVRFLATGDELLQVGRRRLRRLTTSEFLDPPDVVDGVQVIPSAQANNRYTVFLQEV